MSPMIFNQTNELKSVSEVLKNKKIKVLDGHSPFKYNNSRRQYIYRSKCSNVCMESIGDTYGHPIVCVSVNPLIVCDGKKYWGL
jgi:hypothetical protein